MLILCSHVRRLMKSSAGGLETTLICCWADMSVEVTKVGKPAEWVYAVSVAIRTRVVDEAWVWSVSDEVKTLNGHCRTITWSICKHL